MKKYCLLFITALLFGLGGCVPKSELEDANAKITGLEGKLTLAEGKLSDAQKQLAEATAKLAQKSIMPVTVRFELPPAPKQTIRDAILNKEPHRPAGYVTKLDTTIKKDFPVAVWIKSKATGETKGWQITLEWQRTNDFNIPVFEGDEIIIKHTEYSDKTVVCPQGQ